MNQILNYILGAVCVILLTLLGVQGCQRITIKKELAKSNEKYSILYSQWWKLINTPPRITRIKVPVEVVNHKPVYPIPIPAKGNNEPPAGPVPGPDAQTDKECRDNRYDETYHIGDTIRIWWTAKTKGIIKEFNIDKVSYPSNTTIIERFIPCPKIDTSEIIDKARRKWHYGGYAGIWGQNFKVFPGVQAGAFVGWSDKWLIQPGVMYNTNENKFYFSINGLFYIK